MKYISSHLVIALFLITLISCSDDDTSVEVPSEGNSIAEIVEQNPELSNLFTALETADLVADFGTDTELTLLAPNNAAFTQFLELNGFASLGSVPEDELRELLLNHVIEGENLAADFSTGYYSTFSTGAASQASLSLFVDTSDGVVLNGQAQVDEADVVASNGVIHIVDAVVTIPSMATQVTANPEFSLLVEALQQAETEALDFIQLLSASGEESPFTVFAPNNAAFENLLDVLGEDSLSNLDSDLLASILSYHIITKNNVRSGDLFAGLTASTFQGEDLGFSSTGGSQLIDASGTNANIIETDVQTNNGVVHAVDKVLLPQEVIDIIDPTITGLALTNSDLTSLVAALEYTGLDDVLADRTEEFTVFAPNNAAFANFLNGAEVTDLPVDEVAQVLLNHVVLGITTSTELETSYVETQATFGETEQKLNLFIDTNSGVLLNGISSVISPDNTAANGVVHVVDEVIDLPTVATFVDADPELVSLFSSLTNPLQAPQNYVDLLTTPNGANPAPFSIFAPNNAAFDALFVELGVNNIDEIEASTLTAALNTHVVTGFNLRSTDLQDGPLTTLGADLDVNTTTGSLTDPRGRESNLVSINLQAANGVIHTLDRVLLPQE